MNDLTSNIILGLANGGALLAFWIWARNSIAVTQAKVAAMEAQISAIMSTCNQRQQWLGEMNRTINVTARNVVKLATSQNLAVENPD